MKRKISMLLVAGMLLTAMSGCGGGAPAAADPAATPAAAPSAAQPSEGGTLRMGENILDTQMAAKNPFLPNNTSDDVLRLMYEHLLYFNPVSGEVEPELATEYAWNEDFTVLTFTMREGVKWQDGTPLTAEDAAYTYNLLKEEPILDLNGLWSKLSSVAAEGNKVVFTLSETFPSLPYYATTTYIVPKHLWETQGKAAENLNEMPIGSGPFTYRTYNTGTDIQFDANKEYWRGAPKVDSLVMMMYNSSANLTLALLKGDIGCTMNTIAMSSTPEFMTKDGAKMQVFAGTINYAVMVNHENPLLADVRVRKAMAMALNQNDLINKAEYNGVFPVSAGWLPELFGELRSQAAKDSLKYDPEAAMALLESAGYAKGKDGIYAKDGQRLSFVYLNQSGAPAQQMEAGMIQQWLLNIGVEITPRLATGPELIQLLQRGEYDLLQNRIAFPPDPYAALNNSFHSSMTAPSGQPTPGTNYFRYRNADLDALLDKVANETDTAKQKDLYIQIQDMIAADSVFLPMYNLGAHVPYYDGVQYAGWVDNAPVFSTQGIINVYEVK